MNQQVKIDLQQHSKVSNPLNVHSAQKSTRILKRYRFYLKNRLSMIFKKHSTLIVDKAPSPVVLSSLVPMRQEATSTVVEVEGIDTLLKRVDAMNVQIEPIRSLERKITWPSLQSQMPHKHDFAIIAQRYKDGFLAKVKSESGAMFYLDQKELLATWDRRGWPDPNTMIQGWIRREEAGGLPGGNPGRGKKGRRKRKMNKNKRRGKKKQSLVNASQLGMRNPRDMTQFPTKILDEWRYEAIIETDGAGSYSAYCNLRDPLAAVNGAGTYSRAPAFATLYDEFKPIELVIIVDFLQLNVNNGFSRIATDYDSIPSGSYTPGDVKDNEYMREFSGTNQITYRAHVVPLTAGTFRENPSVIHQKGWYDFNSPPQEGFIAITGERFLPSTRIANITLTMRVCMRRRRTITTTRDQRLSKRDSLSKIKLN